MFRIYLWFSYLFNLRLLFNFSDCKFHINQLYLSLKTLCCGYLITVFFTYYMYFNNIYVMYQHFEVFVLALYVTLH